MNVAQGVPMIRAARVGLLIGILLLAALPVLARGGGGHGGGGHGGGGHCGGHHGGAAHGFTGHGIGRGTFPCGIPGHFGAGFGDSGWDYFELCEPTPHADSSADEADDAVDREPSSAAEDAQYRYDHRSGGD